ncbi:MAG: UDP-glucose--hexose-1-phosphate uridylyltransferase [Acidobacteria bacterium]|nr:UDP-glucose--hexose-1-phosphate uridylyltransferase [Acidobacteriota bacterium]MBI3488694.1 UDP-glucose--hexose-1-phosphate uridylyltransferase [Acidobacteriota bacterium]
MFDRSHRRLNLLTGEHVLVSPNRTQRPWQGKVERVEEAQRPAYDPGCYLCPGNARAGGHRNPAYESTFVFDNDFAALSPKEAGGAEAAPAGGLLRAEPVSGTCRVLCFSPRHDLSLPEMSLPELESVLEAWTAETRELSARPDIQCVQVFENKGELMGCSNPHPHSQIWATEHLPNESAKELAQQRAHFVKQGRPLLLDVLDEELRQGERIVVENEGFVALVPFWAQWPFETLILPRRPLRTLLDLDARDRRLLADLLKRLTTRYDNLFEISFPYSMGFHQAPFDGDAHEEWLLHMHFYPPLLRSATVRKFMVGFEMLGMPGRDITPELAAARLREMSERHYKQDR